MLSKFPLESKGGIMKFEGVFDIPDYKMREMLISGIMVGVLNTTDTKKVQGQYESTFNKLAKNFISNNIKFSNPEFIRLHRLFMVLSPSFNEFIQVDEAYMNRFEEAKYSVI